MNRPAAAFAAAAVGAWWKTAGQAAWPGASRLFITVDAGGSPGWDLRLWKAALQRLADELGLTLSVSHFPLGTSKWNGVEYRLFSFLSQAWRGRSLLTYETGIRLISRSVSGRPAPFRLDRRRYPAWRDFSGGRGIPLNLHPEAFQGERNYEIRHRKV